MKKRGMQMVIAALTPIVGSAIAYAHEGMEHVMGTVKAVTNSSITVDTVKHTSVIVLLEAATKFTRNDAQVGRQDVKAGDRVVIEAKENRDKKLVGVTVKLGADHSSQKAHSGRSDHKPSADHHKQ